MSTYTSVCGSPFEIRKRQMFRNEASIRVDMEIYLQHGPQQKCVGLVSAGCLQRDDVSSNSVFNFRLFILYNLIYTSFPIVLIVEPTEYLEYKIRMDLFLFNFLYEAVATLQVTCTLYMQLTFYRGTIIHAINSNELDVTLLFPA